MNAAQTEAFLYDVGHDADGNLEPDDRYTGLIALRVHDGMRTSEAMAVSDDWCSLPDKGWGLADLQHAIVFGSTDWGDCDRDDQADDDADEGARRAHSIEPIKWTDHTGTETSRAVPLCPDSVARLNRSQSLYGVATDGRFFSARRVGEGPITGLDDQSAEQGRVDRAALGDLRPGVGQDPADRLDPEPVAVLVDVGDDHFSRRSSSAEAKDADAVRRISFARRSSRTSRSSSACAAPPRW